MYSLLSWKQSNFLKTEVASAITTVPWPDHGFLIVPYYDGQFSPEKIWKADSDLKKLKSFLPNQQQLKSIGIHNKSCALYDIAVHHQNNKIYVIKHKTYEIIIIDYQTKEFNIFSDNKAISDYHQCILNANGEIHLLGGNNTHCRWNNQTKSFDIIYEFEQKFCMQNMSANYINCKKTIILIGGTEFGIRMFDLKTQQWDQIIVTNTSKCPWKQVKSIVTSDETNIIIAAKNGNIYILTIDFDTKKAELKKSDIVCPLKGICHFLRVGNRMKDIMLVSGYFNRIYKFSQTSNYIPNYISKMTA
eukprot:199557_1